MLITLHQSVGVLELERICRVYSQIVFWLWSNLVSIQLPLKIYWKRGREYALSWNRVQKLELSVIIDS